MKSFIKAYYKNLPKVELPTNVDKKKLTDFILDFLEGEKIIIHYKYDIYNMLITNHRRIFYFHTDYVQRDHCDYWMTLSFIKKLKEKLNKHEPTFTFYPVCNFIKENLDRLSNSFIADKIMLIEKLLNEKEEIEEKLREINYQLDLELEFDINKLEKKMITISKYINNLDKN